MEKKVLIVGLILSLVGNAALAYVLVTRDTVDYRVKYTALKSSYLSLASAQKYLFEVIVKTPGDFKGLMPEYKDVSKERFEEGMRRKIVKLEMEIDELRKQ
jgi:hypothetical protein